MSSGASRRSKSRQKGFSRSERKRSVAHTWFSRSPRFRANTCSGGDSLRKLCCQPSKNSGSDSFHLAHLVKASSQGKINENTKFDNTDFRNTVPRFNPENCKANQGLVDLLSKFAQQKKATPAQLALAWLLAKKPWIVPIPGTTKPHRLDENLGAANVELTCEDLRAIESASSNIKVEGARYPEWLVPMSGR
jgi:hypothetical protein